MADKILQIKLNGLKVDVSIPAFLRYIPMGKVPDPKYIGDGEPP